MPQVVLKAYEVATHVRFPVPLSESPPPPPENMRPFASNIFMCCCPNGHTGAALALLNYAYTYLFSKLVRQDYACTTNNLCTRNVQHYMGAVRPPNKNPIKSLYWKG